MKRLVSAVLLLALIIGFNIYGTLYIKKTCAKTKAELKACKQAFSEKGDRCERLTSDFKEKWDEYHGRLALFTNHSLLDGISSEATTLPIYAKEKEKADFFAGCAKIERFLEQIVDEERISAESFY